MTISAVTRKSYFNGSGSTGPFTFSWKINAASDVVLSKIKDSDGTVTALSNPADYSLTLVANGAGGGSVTLVAALAAGYRLLILGQTPQTQGTPYGNQGAFYGSRHELSFDKVTDLVQELSERIDRCIKIPAVDQTGLTVELPNATLRPNALVITDGSGNFTTSVAYLTTVAASATAAAASATAAAASATAAAASATAAAASATTASTQATNAATSATSASTSATNSATSATSSASSASAASTSATLAQDWATKTNGIVAATDYSSKAWAIGGTSLSDGAAKNWAQQTGADVTGAAALSRSAKSWAQDDLHGATYGGSAKDWASSASLPDGVLKSAKSYATDASTSASSASTSATNSSTSATNSATSATSSASSASASAASATLSAAAAGFGYKFSTNTASSDPTSGFLKVNNATLSAATSLYISETSNDAQAIAAVIATLDDSTNTTKSWVRLFKQSDPTVFAIYSVTGAITDNGTWDTVPISYVSGSGAIANNDVLTAQFILIGDKGATGNTGATGPAGSVAIVAAGGTVDAITGDFTPDLTLSDMVLCAVVAGGANTLTNPTFAPDGLTAHTITKFGGQALVAGDIRAANHVILLEYNLANTRWELLNPVFTQTTITGNAGSATVLQTTRAIYGNNFDGSAALAQIIASTYGGTGNGFTKFSGPASTEKTFTLPNASATILTDNAVVTVAQGGSGLATLTAHNVMIGNGTGNVLFVAPGSSGNVLKSNGTDWTSGTVSSGGAIDIQSFAASGTWTKPGSGTWAFVQVWGGGGSGGSGANTSNLGAGGSGGGYNQGWFLLSTLGATETVTVGTGGAAIAGTSTSGNPGINSTFGAWLTGYAGTGGFSSSTQPFGSGGAGTTGVGTIGTNGTSGVGGALVGGAAVTTGVAGSDSTMGGGGGGGTASTGGNSFYGGGGSGGTALTSTTGGSGGNSVWGGAGGAGATNTGTRGTGGTSKMGGNGGQGGNASNNGVDGAVPGGGGGGTMNGKTSGKGGDGKIVVMVF